MAIQAAGINSYYTYQSAFEQRSGPVSSSSGFQPGIRETDISEALPLPGEEEQIDSVSQTQEDGAPQEENQPSESEIEPGLTQEEKLLVQELEKTDSEVRAHEMAHIAAGGEYITSGATFTYQQGPDGKNYAVGGEVGIDTSPEPGDPEATLKKMRQVRAAALAPAQPSSQDLKVASKAASLSAKAMAEITQLQVAEQTRQMETAVSGYTQQQITDGYEKTIGLSGEDAQSSFHIAV